MKKRKPLKIIIMEPPTNDEHNQSFIVKRHVCTTSSNKCGLSCGIHLRYTSAVYISKQKRDYDRRLPSRVWPLLLFTREANKRRSYDRHIFLKTYRYYGSSTQYSRKKPSHHSVAITHLLTAAHHSNETRTNRMITQANRSFGIRLTWQHPSIMLIGWPCVLFVLLLQVFRSVAEKNLVSI